MKICEWCLKTNKSKSERFCSNICKNTFYVTEWRQRTKRKLVEMFGGSCIRCGYNKCISALGFHHRDPKQKKFGLSLVSIKAWDRLVEEAKKCDLLCANCHAEEHAEQRRVPQANLVEATGC